MDAATGLFAVSGGGAGSGLWVSPGAFAVSGSATLVRNYDVDIGDLFLKLNDLQSRISYFNDQGQPTPQMQIFWQESRQAIEGSFNRLARVVTAIQTAYNAAAQAQAAATEAASTVETVKQQAVEVQEVVEDLRAGNLNLDTVTIGGTRFANDGGTLTALP